MNQASTKKNLVSGDNFRELILRGGFFVDKTSFIPQIFENGNVLLFTRPRRFGKSLTLSMLRYFFEMDYLHPGNTALQETLFKDLDILENQAFCDLHMAAWPVIHISLKDVAGYDLDNAVYQLFTTIQYAFREHSFLINSDKVSETSKAIIQKWLDVDLKETRELVSLVQKGIFDLQIALFEYSGKHVITLIDEYDVPLQKARSGGYYDGMIPIILSSRVDF